MVQKLSNASVEVGKLIGNLPCAYNVSEDGRIELVQPNN